MAPMAFAVGATVAPRAAPTLRSSTFVSSAPAARPASAVVSRRVVMRTDPNDGKGADMKELEKRPATIKDFKAEVSPKTFWSNVGFTPYAERIVGRSAMLGFFIGMMVEVLSANHTPILIQAERLLNVPANLHALQIILTPGAVPPV